MLTASYVIYAYIVKKYLYKAEECSQSLGESLH